MKFLIICLSLLTLWGCDLTKDPVVVTVGDVKLTESDLRAKVSGWDSLSNREQIAWVEAWIDEEVLFQEALKQGLHKEKRIKKLLDLTERKIVVEAFISKVTDSLSMDSQDAQNYYDSHQESFLYDKWLWSGYILTYTDWKWGASYYKSKKENVFNATPSDDFRLKKKVPFLSVAETPDSCLAVDLREISLGSLSVPKVCDGAIKSIVVTSRQDSGAVIPFDVVKDQAHALAQIQKQRDALTSLKVALKKKRPIFSNPQLFSDSLDQKEE